MEPQPRRDLPPAYTPSLPPPYSRSALLQPPPVLPRSTPSSRLRIPENEGPCPRTADAPLPPTYSAFDETMNSFALCAPLVYIFGKSSIRPRYQLSQESSRSGKPWRLRIRRLLPTESRRLSMPTTRTTRSLDYDDDMTLYLIEDVGALNKFTSQRIEIRGRKAKTLPGHITIREDDRKCEFWHHTRNPAGDALKKENERRMQKYRYRADDEWNKTLLFSALRRPMEDKVDWRDTNDKVLANEVDGVIHVAEEVEQKVKDVLISCWVSRRWSRKELTWHTQEQALARTVSLN